MGRDALAATHPARPTQTRRDPPRPGATHLDPEPEPEPEYPDGVEYWNASPRFEWSEYDYPDDGTLSITLMVFYNDQIAFQGTFDSPDDVPLSVTGVDGNTYTRGTLEGSYGAVNSKYFGVTKTSSG